MSDPWTEGFPPPTPRRAPKLDVLTPTFYRPVNVTLLGARIFVRSKHFNTDTRRPYPCTGQRDCRACMTGQIKYPTGFMACCSVQTYRVFILQLSDAAMQTLREYAGRSTSLRGVLVRTTRADTRNNAKMLLEVRGHDERDNLPDEPDVRPTLEEMWGQQAARELVQEEIGGRHDTRKAQRARRSR